MKNPESCDDLTPFSKEAIGDKICLGEGSHTEVRELEENLVVKTPKPEYAPPLLKFLQLGIPRKTASKILETFFGPRYKINPDMDFIKNGVAEFALMSRYFSNRTEAGENKKEPNPRDEMLADLRNEDSPFYKEMLKVLGEDADMEKLASIFEEIRNDNFLPKEQVVVGHPPDLTREKAAKLKSQGKELPYTYYLIQEKIKGEQVKPLRALKEEELKNHPEVLKKLLTFSMLTKKMYHDTDKLIDTRPDEVAKHPFEWFQETSNILVDLENNDVFFVDTRWLYPKDTRFIGSGGLNIIDKLGRGSVDRAIKKYTGLLSGQKNNKI